MIKTIFTLLFLCSVSGLLYAQDTINVYYDNNWVEIPNKAEAVFYRKAYQEGKNVWTVHDYYISNKIQMTGAYNSKKFTKKNGHFAYYAENGNKTSEGNYVDDKLMGPWNYWFETGEKKSAGEYSDNAKWGVWNYWYANGQLQSKETFKKAGNGSFEGYHENGVMSVKGNTVNDLPEGIWMYWNSDGRKILEGNFNHGIRDGEWTRTFRDGEMKLFFKNGLISGKLRGGIVRNE